MCCWSWNLDKRGSPTKSLTSVAGLFFLLCWTHAAPARILAVVGTDPEICRSGIYENLKSTGWCANHKSAHVCEGTQHPLISPKKEYEHPMSCPLNLH